MTHEPLFVYIESKSSHTLTANEKVQITAAFKARHLRKRQYLLQEGDVCKYMAFIVKGAGRMYTMKENSQETIIRLAVESWWLGDYESYNLHTPSIYYIEMTEDSDVLLVTHEDMKNLGVAIPAIDEMVREIDRKGAIATQKRIHAAISMDAEERYELLARTYPEFVRRFPQSMIASYLGISPETLSRVRKKTIYK
ncbi:CRP-like cAMP-binding protein [Dyadobacter sp. BE34]|uniref:CRP-like cAMP-binding protein n=1 Tax=Dyadobacter fermentans TaxID=94254 RepID=A0ABU1QXY5_9BACT|nr:MULTISPECIES: Crp/Fnr family transcriptional regulator [Dyadobacter]MDR6806022.1 CRP-like cAMP-binding protein [Dyadobacter fermentans]MDR7043763.1 CRP-like cAMP-binding protein [Dyadobacter sp. BE242]MDR7198074.1 CRP-like cAMP-binding protein [Dyadobacter sp. BE34]MDR7216037.1 CRP-like cAMP-binding protein [Dyadobacter sp. BE31]MDR7264437.1 CRP-like cAMP-binding protein [Dyadobacter sp. BE32]